MLAWAQDSPRHRDQGSVSYEAASELYHHDSLQIVHVRNLMICECVHIHTHLRRSVHEAHNDHGPTGRMTLVASYALVTETTLACPYPALRTKTCHRRIQDCDYGHECRLVDGPIRPNHDWDRLQGLPFHGHSHHDRHTRHSTLPGYYPRTQSVGRPRATHRLWAVASGLDQGLPMRTYLRYQLNDSEG